MPLGGLSVFQDAVAGALTRPCFTDSAGNLYKFDEKWMPLLVTWEHKEGSERITGGGRSIFDLGCQ
jgi:hypothetical protein